MGFIYMLTSPKNKRYVGQTIRTFEERFKEHQEQGSKCKAIYGAIQKYGWEHMKKEWIEIPDDELNFYEEMLVALLGTLVPSGYNLKEGGGNGRPCEEVKQKMSESHTGKTLTDDHKKNISNSMSGENHPLFGKTMTDDHKQKISESTTGRTHTEDAKKQMSNAKKGDKSHLFGRTGEKHPRSKRVYQYNLDGTFVQSFATGGEAARSLNKKQGTSISECANGKCESAHGFKWSFIEF
ncbi:GIY-YIG catalytic domain-containing endonuclease [Acanthocystis turfacea Chlorella virus GM0701.1]|nr:GIY-YIG catalytic domain-containing endonuclease [Acanthocystis turfacea Chlorella virus GM0701.1]